MPVRIVEACVLCEDEQIQFVGSHVMQKIFWNPGDTYWFYVSEGRLSNTNGKRIRNIF